MMKAVFTDLNNSSFENSLLILDFLFKNQGKMMDDQDDFSP